MQVITTLNAILTEKGISVLKFSKESGIPEGRVYKWLDANIPAKPKSEDVKKIEKWINSKKLENIPPETDENGTRQDQASKKPVTFNSNTTDPAMKIASQLNQKHETLEQAIASIRIIADTYYQESQNHREALAIIKQLLPNRS